MENYAIIVVKARPSESEILAMCSNLDRTWEHVYRWYSTVKKFIDGLDCELEIIDRTKMEEELNGPDNRSVAVKFVNNGDVHFNEYLIVQKVKCKE